MLILPQVRRGRAGPFLLARPVRAHQTSQCVHMYLNLVRVRVYPHMCVSVGVLCGVYENK